MSADFADDFRSPPAACRGKPFWAWNGALEEGELRRQIRVFERMGMGGFFMHARVGLETPYLGREWFDRVRACIDEAGKLGMEAWLYDEDRWPSGFAGGLVTEDPRFRRRSLRIATYDAVPSDLDRGAVVSAVAGRLDGAVLREVEPVDLARLTALPPGKSLIVFSVALQQPSDAYNGFTYVDTLNPEAIRRFIEVTHERYRAEIGSGFGRLVPGIFTDEPAYNGNWDGTAFAWTDRLPEVFSQRYGYSIVEALPAVFFHLDGAAVSRARHHYVDCITHLFVDAFSRQLGEWCAANGIALTGHVHMEPSPGTQTQTVGSAMRFYEHMQVPGMDLLSEYNREYDTAKFVASVARQTGRTWRISEMYGCTGWDFPWRAHKALGDWQAALGINVRCHHLSWYTMAGEAKRDYPASIFDQSPWWEHYRHVEDHYSRIHALMTRGREVRDLLVISPLESSWQQLHYRWQRDYRAMDALDVACIRTRDALLAENLDFDYGDEEMLARLASCTTAGGRPTLTVGQAAYTTVLVPPMVTMRATTLALLERFRAAGGAVVFVREVARHLDAEPSDGVAALAARCVLCDAAGMTAAVASTARRISCIDPTGREVDGLLHLLREDDDAHYLFVCNTGHPHRVIDNRRGSHHAQGDSHVDERTAEFPSVRVAGSGRCAGAPILCDPLTGTFHATEGTADGERWSVTTSFPKLGSRLFIIPKRQLGLEIVPARSTRVASRRALKPAAWRIAPSEPNVLVLDRASHAIGEGAEAAPMEILRIDDAVRSALGMAHRGGEMKQPWVERRRGGAAASVRLTYRFAVEAVPVGELSLAIERPELYAVTLNGRAIDVTAPTGHWVDRSLRLIRVDASALRVGENRLELACRYDAGHPGFEMIYLLGSFGVRVDGAAATVIAGRATLALGDWTAQGFPFYSGSMTYLAEAERPRAAGARLILRVPAYQGVGIQATVDGVHAGYAGWEPNEIDLTDAIRGDRFTLGITVLGHRRNSHGPLHLTNDRPIRVNPETYKTAGAAWTDDYRLVPCGLMAEPELIELG